MDLRKKRWSYSSVKLYETCPYAFYLKYIQDIEEETNAMAEHGSFVHVLLESYYKGEKIAFELASDFEEKYDEKVKHRFPYYNMYKSFYDSTLNYLYNFEGISEENKILYVEQEVTGLISPGLDIPSKGIPFIGYIDLVYEDNKGIVIEDHKSHGKWRNKKERAEYFRQLYIYAYCLHQEGLPLPYKLVFNKFRTGKLDEELFNESDYHEALPWFCNSVEKIMKETEWECKIDSFYCSHLCGFLECVWNGRDLN